MTSNRPHLWSALGAFCCLLAPSGAFALEPAELACSFQVHVQEAHAEIEISVRNRSDDTVVLGLGGSPLDPSSDAYFVADAESRRPFVQPLACFDEAGWILPAGDSLSRAYPLSDHYRLTSGTHFVAPTAPLKAAALGDSLEPIWLDCGTATFQAPVVRSTRQSLIDANVNDCDGQDASDWRNAQSLARYITRDDIVRPVARGVGGTPHWILDRYLQRGDVLTQEMADLFLARMRGFHSRLQPGRGPDVKCLEGSNHVARCNDPGDWATATLSTINLCDAFFEDADEIQQAATLVHEISHVWFGSNDVVSGTASVGNLTSAPRGQFAAVAQLVESERHEHCRKSLSDRARNTCAAFLTVFAVACDQNLDCEPLPDGAATVWEAIIASLILDHFDALYRNHFGTLITADELRAEIARVHEGRAPIDDFAEVVSFLRTSRDSSAEGSAGFRSEFEVTRNYLEQWGPQGLDRVVESAHSADPLNVAEGPTMSDYVGFVGTGQPPEDAAAYFRGLFAAKVMSIVR